MAASLYKAQFISSRYGLPASANHFSTNAFKSAFSIKELEYGYPRNDLMYHPNKDRIAADLRRKLKIPEGRHFFSANLAG